MGKGEKSGGVEGEEESMRERDEEEITQRR